MKKLFTLLSAAFIAGAVSAQITITKNDMPAAGDSFLYATVQAVGSGINVANTGAGHTWNYANLVKNDSAYIKYQRSSQTPYAFYFINTMGQKIADNLGFGQFSMTDVYSFYKTTNTSFTAEGIGFKFNGIPLGGFYTDKDDIYKFPLTYGNSDSASFRVVVQIPAIGTYKQSGKRVNNADGWGTITLPNGNPVNCVRIKSVITQVDSISVTQPFPVSFGFPSTRVEYKWLTNTDKVPVLEVSGTELFGSFTPANVRYRPQSKTNPGPGISVDEIKTTAIQFYPNPATDKIIISGPNAIDAVKLFDMGGREIAVQNNATAAGAEISVHSLSAGYYMLFIKAGNEMVWEKISIIH